MKFIAAFSFGLCLVALTIGSDARSLLVPSAFLVRPLAFDVGRGFGTGTA